MGNVESKFQGELIRDLRKMFRGCIILKNDSSYIQGIPDILVLFRDRWAALECKASSSAPRQPNQEYYVTLLNTMSFAAFITPETKDDILHALQLSLRSGRLSRVPERVKLPLDQLRGR